MATQAISIPAAEQLMHMGDGLILHQALYAAAKLGIADLLASGARSTAENYAKEKGLPVASVQNRAASFVVPSPASATAAIEAFNVR